MSEHDNGWDFAKRLSDALLNIRPLGGSEMFVKRNNKYYADPDYCARLIGEKVDSEIKWIKRAIIAEKKNDTLTGALVKAREAIWSGGDTVAAIAAIDAALSQSPHERKADL